MHLRQEKKNESLHHSFFNFDVNALPQHKKVDIPFINKNIKEPNKEPIKKRNQLNYKILKLIK